MIDCIKGPYSNSGIVKIPRDTKATLKIGSEYVLLTARKNGSVKSEREYKHTEKIEVLEFYSGDKAISETDNSFYEISHMGEGRENKIIMNINAACKGGPLQGKYKVLNALRQ